MVQVHLYWKKNTKIVNFTRTKKKKKKTTTTTRITKTQQIYMSKVACVWLENLQWTQQLEAIFSTCNGDTCIQTAFAPSHPNFSLIKKKNAEARIESINCSQLAQMKK